MAIVGTVMGTHGDLPSVTRRDTWRGKRGKEWTVVGFGAGTTYSPEDKIFKSSDRGRF